MNILKKHYDNNQLEKYLNYFVDNHKTLRKLDNSSVLILNNQINNLIIKNKIYEMKLNGWEEIKPITNKKIKYYIIKSDSELNQKTFLVYMILYYLLSKKVNNNYILPLDFEFNTKKVALMQINFETDFNDRFIFIIYPPYLNYYWKTYLVKKILGNFRIIKLLHGSDSLDIPYMFNDLIIKTKYIKRFIHSMIDTRYICEYFNLKNNYPKRKCKIYNLLLDQNIVTPEKIRDLDKNSEKMGPIYDIFIDINSISTELLKYTLYDVIFLKYLYQSFPNEIVYTKLIPELTRINFLEKKGITNYLSSTHKVINKMNNFFIKDKDNLKLIDTYYMFTNYLNIKDYPINLLENINYFKSSIEIMKKYVIYKNMIKTYKIFINTKTEYKQEFPNTIKFNSKFELLNKLIILFENEIKISL